MTRVTSNNCIKLYLPSFAGTPKNEIPGAALKLYQLKFKQFSPDILKFSTKQEDNPFTLNCLWFLAFFCLYSMQTRIGWVLIIFLRLKNGQFRPFLQAIFLFLMTDRTNFFEPDQCFCQRLK